jgi:TatD DNase family protein
MTTTLPPIDLHAHVDVNVDRDDLRALSAVIFAATRSLAEAEQAMLREDDTIVWGVGSHPKLARSHGSFSQETFADLVERAAFVGEVGLDGSAKVALERQQRTLRSVLDVLAERPRIASLHSYRSAELLLDELDARPIRGVVLHWWLGSQRATRRALEMGCYFSVNTSMFRHPDMLMGMPLDRLLTETDHPFGDRNSPAPRLPGHVLPVEHAIARYNKLQPEEVRRLMWANLVRLVRETGCAALLSRRIRSYLVISES